MWGSLHSMKSHIFKTFLQVILGCHNSPTWVVTFNLSYKIVTVSLHIQEMSESFSDLYDVDGRNPEEHRSYSRHT
jgi:hypothetical protein